MSNAGEMKVEITRTNYKGFDQEPEKEVECIEGVVGYNFGTNIVQLIHERGEKITVYPLSDIDKVVLIPNESLLAPQAAPEAATAH